MPPALWIDPVRELAIALKREAGDHPDKRTVLLDRAHGDIRIRSHLLIGPFTALLAQPAVVLRTVGTTMPGWLRRAGLSHAAYRIRTVRLVASSRPEASSAVTAV